MHRLQSILEEAGLKPRAYSGRGMYGKQCLGVVLDNAGDLFACVLEFMEPEIDGLPTDRSVLIGAFRGTAAFRGMATDSMGRDLIFYFPDIPYLDPTDSVDNGESKNCH